MGYTYKELQGQYAPLWEKALIKPNIQALAIPIMSGVLHSIDRYKAVEAKTGVPAAFIAVVHQREASGKWNTYLGNGDPLNRPSVHVPAGRGPFATWEDGAIDALTYEGLTGIKNWTIDLACWALEKYNGFGYRMHGVPSAYLWAGTNIYVKGKYVADNVWDENAVDQQIGACVELQVLFQLDASLNFSGKTVEPIEPIKTVHGLDDTGPEVSAIQKRLVELGYLASGNITGTFDQITVDQIKKFQADRHIGVDGVVGTQTQLELNRVISKPVPAPVPPVVKPVPKPVQPTAPSIFDFITQFFKLLFGMFSKK